MAKPRRKAKPADSHIAVVGAGSWGTALALMAARNGWTVSLCARDAAAAETMQRERCNARYLPGHRFPDSLRVVCGLPALARAVKLQKRALQYGRAGGDVDSALERVRANTDALRGAQHADAGKNQEAEMLLGQMLFNCADAARHLGLDAEQALRGANRRFAESVAAQTEHGHRPGAKN